MSDEQHVVHLQKSFLSLWVVAVLAFLVPFLIDISPGFDLTQLAYFLLFVPAIALLLLIFACLRRNSKAWLTWFLFCAISLGCWNGSYFLRAHGRWLTLASESKRQVLAQEAPQNGQLRHLDWDGWGMFAQDTEVYLVNDPVNSRIAIHRSTDGLEAKGVPCKFWRAYRLEPHWYALVFFTETGWGACTY